MDSWVITNGGLPWSEIPWITGGDGLYIGEESI